MTTKRTKSKLKLRRVQIAKPSPWPPAQEIAKRGTTELTERAMRRSPWMMIGGVGGLAGGALLGDTPKEQLVGALVVGGFGTFLGWLIDRVTEEAQPPQARPVRA